MNTASSRLESKSPSASLASKFIEDVGLNPAQARVAIEHTNDWVEQYHSKHRAPGVIVYPAVSATEPAGKPIKCCRKVPVELTLYHDGDVELTAQSTVDMRQIRMYRLCCEAKAQGGLLSQEDLAYLLSIDPSTVKQGIRALRDEGLFVPTRGAVKDMGPEPSHKRIIADLLGRGYTTTKVAAMTSHTEGSIGRYQLDFGLVLHLLETYPEASEDQRCQLSGLSLKVYTTYAEVARELMEREDCRPHLDRLRRLYDMDPEGLTRRLPPGKARKDLASGRLGEQNLANAVRQKIQEDLATTETVAKAVAGNLMDVVEASYALPDALRPGELVAFVDAHDPWYLSGDPVGDRSVLPVRLPLYTDQVQEIWRSDEPLGRRRAKVATILASAAYEQGGVTTLCGLAELVHTSPSSLGKDLRELAVDVHVEALTKGLVEDMGPTLTHKDWIVELDHHGLTGEQITWLTRHSPVNRDRYIGTYRRAEILMRLEERIPTAEEVARLFRLRNSVAQQYVDLLHKYHGPSETPPDGPPGTPSPPVEQTPAPGAAP